LKLGQESSKGEAEPDSVQQAWRPVHLRPILELAQPDVCSSREQGAQRAESVRTQVVRLGWAGARELVRVAVGPGAQPAAAAARLLPQQETRKHCQRVPCSALKPVELPSSMLSTAQ